MLKDELIAITQAAKADYFESFLESLPDKFRQYAEVGDTQIGTRNYFTKQQLDELRLTAGRSGVKLITTNAIPVFELVPGTELYEIASTNAHKVAVRASAAVAEMPKFFKERASFGEQYAMLSVMLTSTEPYRVEAERLGVLFDSTDRMVTFRWAVGSELWNIAVENVDKASSALDWRCLTLVSRCRTCAAQGKWGFMVYAPETEVSPGVLEAVGRSRGLIVEIVDGIHLFRWD